MTQICGKWLKYEGKWFDYYFDKRLKMWKMTQRFGKWPKYLGNGLDTYARLKYLRNGFTMLEMA